VTPDTLRGRHRHGPGPNVASRCSSRDTSPGERCCPYTTDTRRLFLMSVSDCATRDARWCWPLLQDDADKPATTSAMRPHARLALRVASSREEVGTLFALALAPAPVATRPGKPRDEPYADRGSQDLNALHPMERTRIKRRGPCATAALESRFALDWASVPEKAPEGAN
jgi:hypothetical protein